MKKLLKISLTASLALSATCLVADEVKTATSVEGMFKSGSMAGQVRLAYINNSTSEVGADDTTASAAGGYLKYETAVFNGLSLGAVMQTSHSISALSGDNSKYNDELASAEKTYTELTEAYINYSINGLNLRAGRQVVDTPLADSDDIRMIANTFEAVTATYEIEKFSLMVGNLQRWQGIDAGLDDGWLRTGESGTNFGGVSYSDILEFNAWYYNITEHLNAAYADIGVAYDFSDDVSVSAGVQYLDESELKDSGEEATIYGAMAEVSAYGLGVSLAYNKSDKVAGKASFSGFGGGTLYTNMDIMIIDEITADRDASAMVAGLSYGIGDVNLAYAYGDFSGDADSAGDKAHIIEQNIVLEYAPNDDLAMSAVYVMEQDKINADSDWNHFRAVVAYNF